MLIEVGEWMQDILEEHFEEAGFLWEQRESALTSAEYDVAAVRRLESRIAAHADALVLAGFVARPLLEPALTGGRSEALAAAHVLLLSGDPHDGRLVIAALREAEGPALDGLRDALCMAAIEPVADAVRELVRTAAPAVAAAAVEALAFHGRDGADAATVERFIRDAESSIREAGWRAASYLGVTVEPQLYAAALRDDAPAVRTAGLLAAAWCGVPGALQAARQAARTPGTAPAGMLHVLAVLGTAEDWPVIRQLGGDAALGDGRFDLLAAFGRPDAAEMLIVAMADDDPASAAAAGAAFTRLTGIDAAGARVTVPPAAGAEGDDVDAEFQDEVAVPDPDLAREQWQQLQPAVASAGRLCRGIDVDLPLDDAAAAALDMRSRGEMTLRARFRGASGASAAALRRFPLLPLP